MSGSQDIQTPPQVIITRALSSSFVSDPDNHGNLLVTVEIPCHDFDRREYLTFTMPFLRLEVNQSFSQDEMVAILGDGVEL